jgi:hypothetical protein
MLHRTTPTQASEQDRDGPLYDGGSSHKKAQTLSLRVPWTSYGSAAGCAMSRIGIIFLVVLFTFAAFPAHASPDATYDEHRAEFLAHFPEVPLSTPVRVHIEEGTHEITLGEAADLQAERMTRFHDNDGPVPDRHGAPGRVIAGAAIHAHAGGKDRTLSSQGAPTFVHDGVFILRETHYYNGENPTNACSKEDGHYDYRTRNPDQDAPERARYTGFTYSDVAEHGEGVILDANGDLIHTYHQPVLYAGHSDFFCLTLTIGGHSVVWNQPIVDGVVIGVV